MTKASARTGAASRRRHPPEVRRGMVLDAAAQLIADEGLLAATMRRIAVAADVSLGTLTHHFASIDDLLGAALERASVAFEQELERADVGPTAPADDRLRALFEGVLPIRPHALRQWRLWLQFWSRAAYDRGLVRVNARRYVVWRDEVAAIVRDGVRAGLFKAGLNVRATAHELVAVMDGLCVAVTLRDPAVPPVRARAVMRRAVSALLEA